MGARRRFVSMIRCEDPSSSSTSSSIGMRKLQAKMSSRHYMLDMITAVTMVGILILTLGSMATTRESVNVPANDAITVSTVVTPIREINKSAEVSVLASGELVAQSPALDYFLTRMLQPFLLEAGLTVTVHSMGIPLIVACSKWLGPYSHSGWTMRHRFVGFARLLKRLGKAPKAWRRILKPPQPLRRWTPARLWRNSKRAVQHLYRKRSRYSVASELTNLVPPESSNASTEE
ncbi:expressed unknown protein [Seminavis robusta]|uniref:Uncharacterized protein n=1 Tax=Seminavis robusta TaxID=568900 RepID=A0A9N8EVG0_9STRA|nr:expressed unknown protein [Seminavis robusta]|eukprot:Sro1805_g298810.1 n/a (233) ;mRNA; r:11707-12405